jgi:hypothetical protein
MLEPVCQPATADRAGDGAEVQHQHEGQRRAQAVAGAGHQLGQPRAEPVHHEQAHQEGDPEHHRAEAALLLEQVPDRRVVGLVLGGQREPVAQLRQVAWLHLRDDLLQLVDAALLDQERHRLGKGPEDQRNQDHRQPAAMNTDCQP